MSAQSPTTAQTPIPLTPQTAHLFVDSTHSVPADLALWQKVQNSLNQIPSVLANPLVWNTWGRLDGTPVLLNLDNTTNLTAYATVTKQGLGLFVQNTSTVPISLQLAVTLPKGIYRIERLSTIIQPQVALRTIAVQSPPALDLHWLQGVVLRHEETITKNDRLDPGELALYRFTDERNAFQQALWDTLDLLHQFATKRRSAANRLRHILYEGSDDYHRLLQASDTLEGIRSLKRASLILGQAQSLCRNYQMEGIVPADLGDALEDALVRATNSISTIGTVILGIAPDMTILSSSPQNPMNPPNGYQVQLSLSNGGLHTISLVKLGLMPDKLPPGFLCDPVDAAVFPNLAPGQAVVANFTLRPAQASTSPPSDYPAEVIYTADGGPIRVALNLNN